MRIHSGDRGFWDIAYSPDGRHLATASDDAIGRIWDSKSGRELAAIPAPIRVGLSVAFSPRGDRFAVGGASASVIAIEGGRECRTETSQTNGTGAVVFHPIQPVLFHSGGDSKLYTWPLDKDAARITWSYSHDVFISVLKIAPEGRELIAGFQKHFQSPPESDYSLRIISPEAPTAERLLKGPKVQRRNDCPRRQGPPHCCQLRRWRALCLGFQGRYALASQANRHHSEVAPLSRRFPSARRHEQSPAPVIV